MELPKPRPFGTESRKPTHDFLSLYSSPVQQDETPPAQGGYLKTHDFLQPLEQVEKQRNGSEKSKLVINDVGKSPPAVVEHIVLPGGIGTYSISHIPNYIKNQHQKFTKPEAVGGMLTTLAATQASSSERNDENSNCSSYTAGSSFTLWDESAAKKGKTGKENIREDNLNVINDAEGVTIGGGGGGQWPPPLSSSNHNHNHNPILGRPVTGQKNQSFIDMIKSAAKSTAQDGDSYDDEDEEFVIKKEPSSSSHTHPHLNGNLSVKVDEGKKNDKKPNTPRSKHSATEQRRRSKINDRFHMLRGLIPHGDQKRDKASFLLEVIEYIQFLQEKVQKYEDSYPGWNHEPPNIMSWGKGKNHGMPEEFIDLSSVTNCGPGPAMMFAAKFDDNKINNLSPTIPINRHNLLDTRTNPRDSFKEKDTVASSIPMLQHKTFPSTGSSSAATPIPTRLASDMENNRSCQQPQSQLQQNRSCMTECTAAVDPQNEEALAIESGTISISTVYSQGLFNTLTQALQSSGVDLSKATISVQIELGKRANTTLDSPSSLVKDAVLPLSNQMMAHSRLASSGNEKSDQALKRQKTGRS